MQTNQNQKLAFFDTRKFEKPYYKSENGIHFDFFEGRLSSQTAELCRGYSAISCFVNDQLDSECLEKISNLGVKLILLRCAGYNNVDTRKANELGIQVCRVPGYSPDSVAEFTALQILCLLRRIHRSYQRTRDLNFSLEGLVGSTLSSKKVGIVGTGQIGSALARILSGFNCEILAHDIEPNQDLSGKFNVKYLELSALIEQSDIISLHLPLTSKTFHMIGFNQFQKMKPNTLIINTSRGGLIDTKALITALKKEWIAGAAIDVYEEEENYFFEDYSDQGIDDDILARLVSFPNVLLTSHQGFLTNTSLNEIAKTTKTSWQEWQKGQPLTYEIDY